MNFERFIAIKTLKPEGMARPIARVAVVSIALGLSVMIVAVAIVTGFQKQIREKVIGFGGHIQITEYNANTSYEYHPIDRNPVFLPQLKAMPGIQHVQVFGIKAGIISTGSQIQGVVMKGIDRDFDTAFFAKRLVEGRMPILKDTATSQDILVSHMLAKMLELKVGGPLRVYFINNGEVRARRFNICGIYETELAEFDKIYIIGDIRHIQKLNNWSPNQVAGLEVMVSDFNNIDDMGHQVFNLVSYNLNSRTIKQLYPQIFDWLELLNMNVVIIIALMIIVAVITMISTLLILILEQTTLIGLLKAMGAPNWSIRRIFLMKAAWLTLKGMAWGNLIALTICILQARFHFLTLPQETYYMAFVPINLNPMHILLINAGTLLVCTIMLVVPSYIIARIQPVKAIRWE
ncbi:MAG: ABC transporter permease [Bacteroidota bacterium]|nr:ABC transporter permease [Bacteroidota bacterium]